MDRVLVSNCISGTVVTNGKYLYYEKGTFTRGGAFGASYENRKIVCLTIRNKSVKGIVNYQSVGKAHSIICRENIHEKCKIKEWSQIFHSWRKQIQSFGADGE